MKKQKCISTVLIVALAPMFFSCSKNEQYLPIEGEVLESRNSPIGITNPISGNTVFYDLFSFGLDYVMNKTLNNPELSDELLMDLVHEGFSTFLKEELMFSDETLEVLQNDVDKILDDTINNPLVIWKSPVIYGGLFSR